MAGLVLGVGEGREGLQRGYALHMFSYVSQPRARGRTWARVLLNAACGPTEPITSSVRGH